MHAQNIKFHVRAITGAGLDLLACGEGDLSALERNLAKVTDEQGFVRQGCQVVVWYQTNGNRYELLATSIQRPGDRAYYDPSHEIVLELIRTRQESAILNCIVQVLRGWPGERATLKISGTSIITVG